MTNDNSKSNPMLGTLTRETSEALGDEFLAAVLYGSAARGDYEKATSDLNVLLVTKNLDPPLQVGQAPTTLLERKPGGRGGYRVNSGWSRPADLGRNRNVYSGGEK